MRLFKIFLTRAGIFLLLVFLTSGSQKELYISILKIFKSKEYKHIKHGKYVYADTSGCSDSDSGGCSDSSGGCDSTDSDTPDYENESYWDDSSSDDSGGCSDSNFKCTASYIYEPDISIYFVSVDTSPTVVTVNVSGGNDSNVASIGGMIRVIKYSDGSSVSFDVVEISSLQYQIINFNPPLSSGEKYSFIFLEGAFTNSDGVSHFYVTRYTVP